MANKFHINAKDEVAECTATQRTCKYAHYDTERAAKIALLTNVVEKARQSGNFDEYFVKRQELENLEKDVVVVSKGFIENIVADRSGGQNNSRKFETDADKQATVDAYVSSLPEQGRGFSEYGVKDLLRNGNLTEAQERQLIEALSPEQAEIVATRLMDQVNDNVDLLTLRRQILLLGEKDDVKVTETMLHYLKNSYRLANENILTMEEKYNLIHSLPEDKYPGLIFANIEPEYALKTKETKAEFDADYEKLLKTIDETPDNKDLIKTLSNAQTQLVNYGNKRDIDKVLGSPVFIPSVQRLISKDEKVYPSQNIVAFENRVKHDLIDAYEDQSIVSRAARVGVRSYDILTRNNMKYYSENTSSPIKNISSLLSSDEQNELVTLSSKHPSPETQEYARFFSLRAASDAVESNYQQLKAEYKEIVSQTKKRAFKKLSDEEQQPLYKKRQDVATRIMYAQAYWKAINWISEVKAYIDDRGGN